MSLKYMGVPGFCKHGKYEDRFCKDCEIKRLQNEVNRLQAQLKESELINISLVEEVRCMNDQMEDEIGRAKDIGFEAGKRGGYF